MLTNKQHALVVELVNVHLAQAEVEFSIQTAHELGFETRLTIPTKELELFSEHTDSLVTAIWEKLNA